MMMQKSLESCIILENYTTIKLGEMYNVHRSTISYIVNNKTYKHLLED
jgi:hypothetical protein